ncbi:deoxyguanosinetriphosphate triphosphohydrolase family protein [Paraburkholderia hospita]|nr:dNTP triphosphohydrolase [Paraburkholderia hospita]
MAADVKDILYFSLPGGTPGFSMPNLYTEHDFRRQSGIAGVDRTREKGRTPFRKDYARLTHAASFRRLQGKTQLFPGTESDFFRNRLTHSLEVAQIASGIASHINATDKSIGLIDLDLVQFAALAHDLGHPPFGHNGEAALDEMMLGYGGFEGNAQTLRIVAVTEQKFAANAEGTFSGDHGLNLTMRTLASVLKYDEEIPRERATTGLCKGYYASEGDLVARIKSAVAPGFAGRFKTVECSIMDLADDIAYSTYDLEDSLHGGFITPLGLLQGLYRDPVLRKAVFDRTNKALLEVKHAPLQREEDVAKCVEGIFANLLKDDTSLTNGGPVDDFEAGLDALGRDTILARNSLLRNQFTAERVGSLIDAVELIPNPQYPQLSKVRLSHEATTKVEVLKHLNFELVIRSSRLAVVEHRGKDVVRDLFKTFFETEGKLLPDDWKQSYVEAPTEAQKARVVCDFVAGMTDRYAAEMHERLFGRGLSIFKPL